MECKIRTISLGKWFGIIPAVLVYYGTEGLISPPAAIALGLIFGVTFWLMLKHEEIRLIGTDIAEVIKEAVTESWSGDHLIEIKRVRSGLIARIYLIGPSERLENVKNAIGEHLSGNRFRKHLWVMQMTSLKSRNDIEGAQKALNRQLMDSIMEQARKRK